MERTEIIHPIPPFFRPDSEILILGSFPSVKSREQRFFYGHPQNRFWRVLAAVYEDATPNSIPEKCAFLEKHRVALWDSIARCTIIGSADSTIRDVVPNDLKRITDHAPIRSIFCNGKTSGDCYARFVEPTLKRQAITLPSTSPANASYRLERLITAWQILRDTSL